MDMTSTVLENGVAVTTVTPIPPPAVEIPPEPHKVLFGEDTTLDRNTERLIRMTSVISKFAGTLTLRPIKVQLDEGWQTDSPAWSDSDSITFVASKVGDLTDPRKVTSLKGLSLHEISHIMFTPRYGSILAKNVQKAKLWPAFNALEDQRIEMLMTTKFSSVSDWLTATIAQHLLSQPNQVPIAFPLLYGRKYLPSEVRKIVRDSYEQPQHVAELSKLIDRYIVLNLSDPKLYPEALEIITKYNELVNKLEGTNPNYPEWGAGWARIVDPNKHCARKNGEWKSSQSKPMSKAQQDSIVKRISVSNGDEYDDNAEPNATASGAEAGHGDATRVFEDVVQTIITTRAREITHSIKQFSGDAELTGAPMKPLDRHDYLYNKIVPPSVVQASKSFAAELERLKAEHDPSWVREQSHGRLNVQRYVTGCDVDEAFDQWDEGREDAVDIEAVILLDISGSMGWTSESAYHSMWAIKRALDKVNASTTVLTFGNKAHVLYSADERASTQTKYAGLEGSTEPLKALKYTRSILANSKRAIKIAITITDGVWWGANDADDILRYLRKAGVLTAMAYVSNPEYQKPGTTTTIDTHGCAVAVNITNGNDLFTLARKMVKVGVASNLTR
jgi:hypothetical protein